MLGLPYYVCMSNPKKSMQAQASRFNHTFQCQFRRSTEWNPYGKHPYGFLSTADPVGFINRLVAEGDPRLVYPDEIIRQDQPCRIAFDFDSKDGLPPGIADFAGFRATTEASLAGVMASVNIAQSQYQCVWKHTVRKDSPKFSAHLILKGLKVETWHPNGLNDGARYFADALIAANPVIAPTLDFGVYSRDRGLRLAGFSKAPAGNLRATGPDDDWEPAVARIVDPDKFTIFDTLVSRPEPGDVLVQVPLKPKQVPRQPRPSPRKPSAVALRAGDAEYIAGEDRLLELIRVTHPTAAVSQRSASDNIFDPSAGLRFNHKDRTERCWCGRAHLANNYTGYYRGDRAFVYCYGVNKEFLIGNKHPCQFDVSGAIPVHLEFLDRNDRATEDGTTLNQVTDDWVAGKFPALGVQAPMGRGKTTYMRAVEHELEDAGLPGKCLYISYRVSLANNVHSTLVHHGYSVYTNVKATSAGDPLAKCEKVIVQLDSLPRVCANNIIPKVRLLVLDEIESLLNHSTADTIDSHSTIIKTLANLIQNADRVLFMDAFIGPQTVALFNHLRVPYKVVTDTWRPAVPRTYIVTCKEDEWSQSIFQKLLEGKNVVVAGMSSGELAKLKTEVLAEGLLPEDQIRIITSKTDDAIKMHPDINTDWKVRLLLYSPSVESGVDFNQEWFDCMYVYVCQLSTTPLGVSQMTGRIRKLREMQILTCVKGSTLADDSVVERMTPEEMLEHLRWREEAMGKHDAVKLEREPVRLSTGETAMLPASPTVLLVTAHNYARQFNSEHRFMHEWAEMIEYQGNKLVCNPSCWDGAFKAVPNGHRKEKLLAAPQIDSHTADQLRHLVDNRCATEEQKWQLERFFHERALNVSSITEDILDHHGMDHKVPELALLKAIVAPPQAHTDGFTRAYNQSVQASLITELCDALQLRVTDLASSVEVTPELKHRLAATKIFTEYSNAAKLFELRDRRSTKLDLEGTKGNQQLVQVLATVFRRAGVGLASSAKRRRVKCDRIRDYTISFNSQLTERSMDLLKLQPGGQHASADIHRDIQGWTMKHYGDLRVVDEVL